MLYGSAAGEHGNFLCRGYLVGESNPEPGRFEKKYLNRSGPVNNIRINMGPLTKRLAPIVNSTETTLLNAITRGDKAAMRQLYEQYLPRLARFLYRVTRDRELIQELTNDVMLTVWQNASGFRGKSAVSTWILGIAWRKALDATRRHKRYDAMINSLPEPSGEEPLRAFDAQRDLDRLLSLLTPEQRAVAELSFDFGYSYPEIAEILDVPVNTVKTRMFYARQIMQDFYEKPSGSNL